MFGVWDDGVLGQGIFQEQLGLLVEPAYKPWQKAVCGMGREAF